MDSAFFVLKFDEIDANSIHKSPSHLVKIEKVLRSGSRAFSGKSAGAK